MNLETCNPQVDPHDYGGEIRLSSSEVAYCRGDSCSSPVCSCNSKAASGYSKLGKELSDFYLHVFRLKLRTSAARTCRRNVELHESE